MKRNRRPAGRGLVALGIAATLALTTAAPASALTPKLGSSRRTALFAPDWKTFSGRTDAQWSAAAKNFAVLVGTKLLYADRIRRLHDANPDVMVLLYNLGPYLQKDSANYVEVMRDHPEWFARDASGNLIIVKTQTDMTLMDQGNPEWRAYHVDYVKSYVLDNGFDGTQVDCLGWGPIKGYTDAVPVDPSTNQPYTVTQWLQFSVATLNAMKDALGASKFVGFNGLANGTAYAQATKALVNSKADGATAEGFVRDALDATDDYPTVQEWLDNLRMMSDVAAKGKAFFAWTKTWRAATDQQRANWNTFALATYLLGRGNYSYYDFLPSIGVDRTAVPYANEQADLGKPLGAYTVGAGVYSRKFEHGVVWVDPVKHTAAINVTS